MGKYQNVFDDKQEFEKLFNLIVKGINDYTETRQGNVTYGEIMFVLESVLEEFSDKCGIDRVEDRIAILEENVARIMEKLDME